MSVLEEDEDPHVRAAAARALGDLGITDAGAMLKKMLDSESNMDVIDEVKNALEKL